MKNRTFFLLFVIFICINAVSPSFAKAHLPDLIKKVSPSVVVIVTFDDKGEVLAQGSGFFINKQGDIITNYHVIEGASSAEIKTAEGDIYHIDSILSQNIESDLVKLSIESHKNNIAPLSLCKDIPEVGEQIAVIGCPLGLEKTVSTGIVSAVREIPHFGEIIQIDAAISPGSSGSPVVNMKAKAIGVATFQILEGQNLNFAIPTKKILHLSQNKVLQLSELQTIDKKKKMLYVTSYDSLMEEQYADCDKEDYEASITCLEEKIKKNPNDWLAYLLIANYMTLLERPEDEKEALKQGKIILGKQSEKDPNNPVIHCFLGDFCGELKEPEKSKEEYEKAILCYEYMIEKNPNDYRAYREIAEIYYWELDDVNASIETYKNALRVNPYSANLYLGLAEKYASWKVHNSKEAIIAYKKALELQPDNIQTCYSFAEYLPTLGMYDEAIKLNKHIIEINPEEWRAFKNIGSIYYSKLEDYPKAIEYYKQAIKLEPANTLLSDRLASVYEKMGKYQDAVEVYKQVILLEPNTSKNYGSLAEIYYKLGNYQEAIRFYKKAINIDDWGPSFYCLPLGNIYGKISDYKNAIIYHKRAIQIDPDYAEAYCALGDDYFALNTLAKAIKSYKQAIKLDPDYSAAHYKLGICYVKLRNTVSAVKQYKILKPLNSNLSSKLKDELVKSGLWRQKLKTFKYNFRKAKWGMSVKQVKKTEKGPITFEGWVKELGGYDLEYDGYVSDRICTIAYLFRDNKLVEASYIFQLDYDNYSLWYMDYDFFERLLKEKYGDLTYNHIEYWSDTLYKHNLDMWGYAVLNGHLRVCASSWESTTTRISLSIFNHSNKVAFMISYEDKAILYKSPTDNL